MGNVVVCSTDLSMPWASERNVLHRSNRLQGGAFRSEVTIGGVVPNTDNPELRVAKLLLWVCSVSGWAALENTISQSVVHYGPPTNRICMNNRDT